MRAAIVSPLVRHELKWFITVTFEQPSKGSFGGLPIPAPAATHRRLRRLGPQLAIDSAICLRP
jgi:hypothetical protein